MESPAATAAAVTALGDSRHESNDERRRLKKEKKKRKREKRESAAIDRDESEERKRRKKEKKKRKQEKREAAQGDKKEPKRKMERQATEEDQKEAPHRVPPTSSQDDDSCYKDDKMIQSSALEFVDDVDQVDHSDTTLVLFYQYVEPPWDDETYKEVLTKMEGLGKELGGRMRVAKEGLNCTLSGTHKDITTFCKNLRHFSSRGEFAETEFKLTKDLPIHQRFPNLKIIPVQELVNYGLNGSKAPPISYSGVHLDPEAYHEKLGEDNTVVIDVRNHYEASIGRFVPEPGGAEWIDPKMRKSTEFPVWLEREETRERLKNKQVLMYCTGGVRCERASALLKFKMENDPEVRDLGIKGVYQLQGGIDKYFKRFSDGGMWSGQNYTFDKRFAHAPPKIASLANHNDNVNLQTLGDQTPVMGKCEACNKPWNKFRGKRRCPTCGVPSLICKECMLKDKSGEKKLGRDIRCELCVQQDVRSKKQLKEREQHELQQYEHNLANKGILKLNGFDDTPKLESNLAPNPDRITRLKLKNMCRTKMNETILQQTLPGITHIVWRSDRSGQFFGQGWIELATPQDAAKAVSRSGEIVLGRPLYISFDPPDSKDRWPPPKSGVY